MNASKQPLNRTGQVGLVVLIGSLTLATFSAGPAGLIEIFCGILGFYLLTHQDAFRRHAKLEAKKEAKP
jgi:hypothetical protein